MNAVVESVRSLWIPLEGINLMLPNGAVAAVINYQPLDMVENGPHWLLGVVRWRESVMWMGAQGVTDFWEIGAGKALIGMVRRIDRAATTRAIGSAADVQAATQDG